MCDLQAMIRTNKRDYLGRLEQVLDSGKFILGEYVEEFESRFARYLGVRHAVGVNSGTDALVIGLRAAGIGVGDEVVTTPFTFFATAEAISAVGATPVFVDIHPATFTLDVSLLEAAITPKTRAILPVHLFGQAANMDVIAGVAARHDLLVVEDAAQATGAEYRGAKVGALGEVGAFSFFPSKPLGGFGDGGMVVTNDDAIGARARSLRSHGARKKYYNEEVGYNSRLDALQAALLTQKLDGLDDENRLRREAAARYDELFSGIPDVSIPAREPGASHVHHQYTLRIGSGRRDAIVHHLHEHGIQSMIYYPTPLHRLPVYRHLQLSLPQSELASREVISIPFWPGIDPAVQVRVFESLREGLCRPFIPSIPAMHEMH